MWQDRTFWILFAVSVLVFGFMALGTVYDLYLVHQNRHFFSENYTYEITRALPPHLGERSIKLAVDNFMQTATSSPTEGVINHGLEGSLGTLNESINTASNDSDTSEKQGLVSQIILAFSVRRNVLTICDQSVGSDTIPTIHGLRSISMGWVILGHTCIVIFKYSDNMEYRNIVEKEFLFQTINNGAYSVDTFFFISGLLVSFLYFRTVAKIDMKQLTRSTGFQSSALQYLGLMVYRYGRLTVPYLFVLGIVEVTMKWFYYNSVFESPTADHVSCPNYWWRNALYINTLFPVKDMCMLWSWYLADDTQFYVLGCALLILAISYFRAAAALTIIFLISSWCTTAFIAYDNRHNPSVDDPLAVFDKIYDKPWTRLGPYLIGMIVGWILYKTDCKIKMSKVAVVLGWSLCIGCLLALVYGLYNTKLEHVPAAAYSSLSHSVWAIGLSWIVIACSTGHGGYVNKLLSASFLYPFSRVTYCAYLVHPIMIRLMVMRLDSPMHLSLETITIIFFGQVTASYILSFIVSLAFEAPMVSLLKIVAPERRKKSQ
ncbi:Nose resistant to fluoxetine protein 6 [Zootermopsis nevadensis]|uniref:Nose resistant to fluoxetine protein 6 n=3 Tax=Zootermopsis nevadensis TaxID=136037 RepID=A0A067QLU3_ZOONE|nr:Nose resistant to fluoxetine protein 6 [Zootermopsis nevadensis]